MESRINSNNNEAAIFIDPYDRSIEVVYKLELTEEQVKIYVTGLDSSLRLLGQQISNAQSPGLALKQLLPEFVKINQQFDFMQAALDAKIGSTSKDTNIQTDQQQVSQGAN